MLRTSAHALYFQGEDHFSEGAKLSRRSKRRPSDRSPYRLLKDRLTLFLAISFAEGLILCAMVLVRHETGSSYPATTKRDLNDSGVIALVVVVKHEA